MKTSVQYAGSLPIGLRIKDHKKVILITATLIDLGDGIQESDTLILWEDESKKLQIDLKAIKFVEDFHHQQKDNKNA